jgi:hypothetical protein
MKTTFQKFYTDIDAQFCCGILYVERQHGAGDHIWFFVIQLFSPVISTLKSTCSDREIFDDI